MTIGLRDLCLNTYIHGYLNGGDISPELTLKKIFIYHHIKRKKEKTSFHLVHTDVNITHFLLVFCVILIKRDVKVFSLQFLSNSKC